MATLPDGVHRPTFLGDAPVTHDVRLVGYEDHWKVGGGVGRRQLVEEVARAVVRVAINHRVDHDERVRTLRVFHLQLQHAGVAINCRFWTISTSGFRDLGFSKEYLMTTTISM